MADDELQQLREEQRARLAQDIQDLRNGQKELTAGQDKVLVELGRLREQHTTEMLLLHQSFARATEVAAHHTRITVLETDKAKLYGAIIALGSLSVISSVVSWLVHSPAAPLK